MPEIDFSGIPKEIDFSGIPKEKEIDFSGIPSRNLTAEDIPEIVQQIRNAMLPAPQMAEFTAQQIAQTDPNMTVDVRSMQPPPEQVGGTPLAGNLQPGSVDTLQRAEEPEAAALLRSGQAAVGSVARGAAKTGVFAASLANAAALTAIPGQWDKAKAQWQRVSELGDQAPLQEISDALGMAMLVYGGYEGLKAVPALYDLARNSNVVRKLRIPERGLAKIPDEQMYRIYQTAPDEVKKEMATYNPQVRDILLNPDKVARFSTQEQRPVRPPTMPQEVPGAVVPTSQVYPVAEAPAASPRLFVLPTAPVATPPGPSVVPKFEETQPAPASLTQSDLREEELSQRAEAAAQGLAERPTSPVEGWKSEPVPGGGTSLESPSGYRVFVPEGQDPQRAAAAIREIERVRDGESQIPEAPNPVEPAPVEAPQRKPGEAMTIEENFPDMLAQPWTQTKDSYIAVQKSRGYTNIGRVEDTHRRSVEDRIKSGQPVPPAVLKDYPELERQAARTIFQDAVNRQMAPKPEPVKDIFTREEIEVSKPQVTRRRTTHGTNGQSVTNVSAPSKVLLEENWTQFPDTKMLHAHVSGQIDFTTGKVPMKKDPVWIAYAGRPTEHNPRILKSGLTYKDAVEVAKDYVHYANPNRQAEFEARKAKRIAELDSQIKANEEKIARAEGGPTRAKEISLAKPMEPTPSEPEPQQPRTLDQAIQEFGFPADSHVSKDMRLYRAVDLFRNMEGGIPEVVKRFRKPGVLGTASNTGKIKLNRLLGMNENMAALVLTHEISHVADALYGDTTQTYARGNILGRIGSMDRYLYNNLKNTVMDEASMAEKMTAIRDEALRSVKLEADGKSLKGPERAGYIKDRLKAATADAFAAQGFITKKEITDELTPLAKWWNGSDMAITKPEELYAEAMSVMLLSPKDLAQRAPKFYAAVTNWLGKKPEFEQALNDFWAELAKGPEEGIGKLFNQVIDDAHMGETTRVEAEKSIAESKHVLSVKEQAARLYDYTWPLLNRMEENNLKRWDQPFAAVQEMNHSAVIIEAYATDIRDKVQKELAGSKKLNQDILHAYLFAERIRSGNYETDAEGNLIVKVGDRSTKLNSRGVTQQSAAELQDHIKKLVGDEYPKLQEIAQNLYSEHRKILERFGEGPFGKDLNDKLMDNETYVTFEPVKYIEEKAGGRAAGAKLIYTSIGDLGPIGNTVVSTVKKDMDLINNLTKYNAREKFFEFGMMAGNGMVIPAKTIQGGFFDKPKPNYQTVYWLWDGKLRAMHVHNDYAPIVNGESTEIEKLMGPLNALLVPFKLMYVNLRAAFFAVNIFKDASATSLNMPEYKFFSLSQARPKEAFGLGSARAFGLVDAIARSFAEVPEAIRHQTGKVTSQAIQDMKRLGIGASHNTEVEQELTQAGRGLERLLRQRGVLVPGAKFESNLDAMGSYLLFAVDVVNASDLATKMAAVKLLKEKHPEYTEAHIADIVNTQAGTPDTTNKGLLTPLYNWAYMYSHVASKGFQGSARAAKEDPKAFYPKLIAHSVMPRVMVWAAKLGLMGAAAKEIYDNIPENFLAGYVNIPLGKTAQGKSVHITISQDEATRVAGGIAYYTLKNMDPKDRKDLLENFMDALLNGFDYAQNQMPGYNPVLKMGGQLASMWNLDKGKGPTGGFGQELVPERIRKEWPERRGRAWGRIGSEWWNNSLGMGQFYRFSDNPDEIQSALEKGLNRTPILGDMLRRFVRVSSAGKTTGAYEAKQDVAAEKAGVSNDRVDRMVELRDEFIKANDAEPKPGDVYGFYQQMIREMPEAMKGVSVSEFRRSFAAYTVGAKGIEGRVQAVFKAGSNEAKAAALEQLSREMDPAALNRVIKQALHDRMLSPKAIQSFRRAQRKSK